jgi:hypothetical protein
VQQRHRWPPCHAARGPPASPSLHASPPSSPTASTLPAGLPQARHAAPPLSEPPAAACYRRPSPLTTAAALPVPPSASAAPTRRYQADRRPSPSPLAFSRARHAALPLPELCPTATSPPSWLAPCVPPPPFFSGQRPSVAPLPSILLSLAFAFHPEPWIHHRRPLFVSDELCSPWADHPSPS